jgi:hypothetical protein
MNFPLEEEDRYLGIGTTVLILFPSILIFLLPVSGICFDKLPAVSQWYWATRLFCSVFVQVLKFNVVHEPILPFLIFLHHLVHTFFLLPPSSMLKLGSKL